MADFLRLLDRSGDEIVALTELASELESQFARRRVARALDGRRIATWWDGEGFRNRVAFELGAGLLGATTAQVPGPVLGREPVGDVGRYLGNWFDAVVVRTPSFEALSELAEATPAMVVNARTDHNHPCEILGDLAFLHTVGRGPTASPTVVFVGEATNLCHSWFEAAASLPMHVIQVCPPGFEADLDRWAEVVPNPIGTVGVSHDLDATLPAADVLSTDCWPRDPDHGDLPRFGELQITAERLDRCRPDLVFLPCPPVSRGREVSVDAMTHRSCRVFEAKHWLLHAQNALLVDGLASSP